MIEVRGNFFLKKKEWYFVTIQMKFKFQVSRNKDLWEHSQAHSWVYYLWLLSCSKVAATETLWLAKTEIFTIWPFTENIC